MRGGQAAILTQDPEVEISHVSVWPGGRFGSHDALRPYDRAGIMQDNEGRNSIRTVLETAGGVGGG